jgi:hypothetical protein
MVEARRKLAEALRDAGIPADDQNPIAGLNETDKAMLVAMLRERLRRAT